MLQLLACGEDAAVRRASLGTSIVPGGAHGVQLGPLAALRHANLGGAEP